MQRHRIAFAGSQRSAARVRRRRALPGSRCCTDRIEKVAIGLWIAASLALGACADEDGGDDGNATLSPCDPFEADPRPVVSEYAAELADDRLLVVTRPEDDFSYDDFRLFLGPEDAVEEREVHRVTRARDGGSTTIEFALDGQHATVRFPVTFDPAAMSFEPGTPTLEVGGNSEELELLAEPPAGVEYRCF